MNATERSTQTRSRRVYACELHARLIANTDALYADEINHEQHGIINGRIWREIEANGLQRAVLGAASRRRRRLRTGGGVLKLRALIERLEEIEQDLRDGLGDDVEPEVVAAIQPSYPLTATIDGVAVLEDEDEPVLMDGRPIVWITTGTHPDGISPYAPRALFDAAS